MNHLSIVDLREEDRAFAAKAVDFCERIGPEGALLLVGSWAVGFADAWSDLDLWVIGHRGRLMCGEQETYDEEGQLFMDRGDYEAHYTFHDIDEIRTKVEQGKDATMWILSTAKHLHGSTGWLQSVFRHALEHPREVAEAKLRRELSRYMAAKGGRLAMSARSGDVATAVAAVGDAIDAVCRICCLAERKPYPYAKWRVRVARETTLGQHVFPAIDCAVEAIDELRTRPSHREYKTWTPIAELRGLRDTLVEHLRAVGWQGKWLDDLERFVTFPELGAGKK
jgi:predicted nucleotidyltransferase